MTITMLILWVICHLVVRIDTAYYVQNLTTLGSAVPMIWLEPLKGSHDLTTPLSGTICRPKVVTGTFDLYIKFKIFAITNYEDA